MPDNDNDSETPADGAEMPSEIAAPDIPSTAPLPLPRQGHARSRGMRMWMRNMPFVTLLAYYAVLIAVVVTLSSVVPTVREAFFTPIELSTTSKSDAIALIQGQFSGPLVTTEAETLRHALQRSLTTFLVILGAMSLVVPVGWVYMQTKRLRYDPALVRAVVILPIVVAGITMVVKYSIALAFALTGIVAAVRFRNTLKDPRDAVYIFLVLGIGLASGVQELDVALMMSMVFNLVMLILWRYNIGSIYGGGYGRTGILSTGDPALLVAQVPAVRKKIRRSMLQEVEDMQTDGILIVHAEEVDLARHTVQETLTEMVKDWRLVRIAPREEGLYSLEYVVRLKKKTAPADLVGALDERWSEQVCAAEYFPFRQRSTERDEASDKKPKSEDDENSDV